MNLRWLLILISCGLTLPASAGKRKPAKASSLVCKVQRDCTTDATGIAMRLREMCTGPLRGMAFRVEVADSNGDGKPDLWKYFRTEKKKRLRCKKTRNPKGGSARIELFDSQGKLVAEAVDSNLDHGYDQVRVKIKMRWIVHTLGSSSRCVSHQCVR